MTPLQRRHLQKQKIGRGLFSGTAWGLLLGLVAALGGTAPALAASDDVETAALAPGLGRVSDETGLPQPLQDADAEYYRRIFRLQDKGHWHEADREIAKLGSKLLLGHVLAQRYLSSKGYRAKYSELSHWLEHYADHPEAGPIYKLAMSRMPKGIEHLRRPESSVYTAIITRNDRGVVASDKARPLSTAERRRLDELRRAIRHEIDEGDYGSAAQLLASKEAQRLFDAVEYDQRRAEIVSGYYFLNKDQEALAIAEAAPRRTKQVNATVEWAGGLAAWRLKRYDKASYHFGRLAAADTVDSRTRSAGAYWAARSYIRRGEFEKVSHWLEVGANFPYTFYGILARKLAGKSLDYNWELPVLTRRDVAEMASVPAGVRALALVQVGEDGRAEQELRRLDPSQPEMAHALLAVSERADMPTLSIQLAELVTDSAGRRYDAALYPLPSWQPQGGYSIDRALVFALIRQESRFVAGASSPAGARGLMQLMPATARFVATGTEYRGRHYQLFEPELNIALGQNYLAHLMSIDEIGGNMFMIIAAYNGGPGNVTRWQREIKHGDDPLLFLESIPSRETRQFVEHVLANYWIYRDELGERTPSLDAIAQERWPTYNSDADNPVPVAFKNGGN